MTDRSDECREAFEKWWKDAKYRIGTPDDRAEAFAVWKACWNHRSGGGR